MSLGCFAACVICSNTGTVDFFCRLDTFRFFLVLSWTLRSFDILKSYRDSGG